MHVFFLERLSGLSWCFGYGVISFRQEAPRYEYGDKVERPGSNMTLSSVLMTDMRGDQDGVGVGCTGWNGEGGPKQ
jgi:hypothetical protein